MSLNTYNKGEFVGRLTAELRTKKFDDDTMVVNGTIATNDSSKKKADGTYEDITEYTRFTARGKYAELLAKAGKGDLVMLIGRMQTRTYTDSDEKKVYVTELIIQEFPRFLAKAPGGESSEKDAGGTKPSTDKVPDGAPAEDGSDVPDFSSDPDPF